MINSSIDLRGRTCIVTGAAQGIGAAEASVLADCGATVLCVDLLDPGRTVASIHNASGRATAWQGDITDPDSAEAVVAAAADLGSPVAVLVNNAGIVRDRMAFNLTDADWDAVLAVNLTAPFRLCRAVIQHWRTHADRTPRSIINTTSESGLYGNAGQANYAAAKAGIAGLTLTLAAELARHEVTVNAVAPRAHTPMSREAFGETADDRLAPQYVATVVAWLASEHARSVTGQILVAAGRDVQRLDGWSPQRRTTQPDVWTEHEAERLHAGLFPDDDGRNVPGPIADLFAPPVTTEAQR